MIEDVVLFEEALCIASEALEGARGGRPAAPALVRCFLLSVAA